MLQVGTKIENFAKNKPNVLNLYLISISNSIISSAPQCDHYQFILAMTGTIFINSIHVTHMLRILFWGDLLFSLDLFWKHIVTHYRILMLPWKTYKTSSLIMHKAPAKNLIYKLYKPWSYA